MSWSFEWHEDVAHLINLDFAGCSDDVVSKPEEGVSTLDWERTNKPPVPELA